MPDDNDPLYKIVFAETKPYFSGDKTLDEVIDVIQSRATLYLQEKKTLKHVAETQNDHGEKAKIIFP